MSKFVSLSIKNLNKILNWVEDNDESPLADAYTKLIFAASKLSEVNGWILFDEKSSISDDFYVRRKIANDAAFESRDTLGRHILKIIKKEGLLNE